MNDTYKQGNSTSPLLIIIIICVTVLIALAMVLFFMSQSDNKSSGSEGKSPATENFTTEVGSNLHQMFLPNAQANARPIPANGTVTYSVRNLTDGNLNTAFVITKPYGNLQISFPITGEYPKMIKLYNGYQKGNAQFVNHGRFGEVKVYAFRGNEFVEQLYSGSLFDAMGAKDLPLAEINKPYDTLLLEFPSQSISEGQKYNQVAITEIKFYR